VNLNTSLTIGSVQDRKEKRRVIFFGAVSMEVAV